MFQGTCAPLKDISYLQHVCLRCRSPHCPLQYDFNNGRLIKYNLSQRIIKRSYHIKAINTLPYCLPDLHSSYLHLCTLDHLIHWPNSFPPHPDMRAQWLFFCFFSFYCISWAEQGRGDWHYYSRLWQGHRISKRALKCLQSRASATDSLTKGQRQLTPYFLIDKQPRGIGF